MDVGLPDQIRRLQLSCPEAAFIVIGPSDMSTKIKDKYVTYELLPDVVENIKKCSTFNRMWFLGHVQCDGWLQ